ncbi:MAG: lytic transglycosylase, partial [Pseudomonadota bacterium]|nr:lytic transglycosylase [Pseudomonadota bacterium]
EGHDGYQNKSYRKKKWLLKVAERVATRADRYRKQLKSCPL